MAAVLAEWPAAAMSPSLVSRVRAGVCVCGGGEVRRFYGDVRFREFPTAKPATPESYWHLAVADQPHVKSYLTAELSFSRSWIVESHQQVYDRVSEWSWQVLIVCLFSLQTQVEGVEHFCT